MAVRVQDTIKAKNDADFPVVETSAIKGGHQEVADATARNAITTAHRSIGMFVVTQDDGKVWQLNGDLTTWTEFTGGGGGGTLDGDVTGPSATNVVSAIRGITSPDPAATAEGATIAAHAVPTTPTVSFASPRSLINDGTNIYLAQSGQLTTPISGPATIYKLTVSGTNVTFSAVIDLSLILGTVVGVRDLAQDATYLYATTFDAQHVAVIDKASFTVVGWANVGGRTISVTTDGSGNFYVLDKDTPAVHKYTTASVLGQAPGNLVPPVASCAVADGRWLRYGGGKLWLTVGYGFPTLYKIDPTTMVIDLTITISGGAHSFSVIYAFGAVWVTGISMIHRINPTTGITTHTLPALVPFSGFIMGIELGPNALGTPDQYLFLTSQTNNYIGIIDPTGPTWISSFSTGIADRRYEGITSIANFVYFAGFKSIPSTTVGVDVLDMVAGPPLGAFVAVPYDVWGLRYRLPAGDVTGPIDVNIVSKIRGITSPDPTGKSDNDLVELSGSSQQYTSIGGDLQKPIQTAIVRSIKGVLTPVYGGEADGYVLGLNTQQVLKNPYDFHFDSAADVIWIAGESDVGAGIAPLYAVNASDGTVLFTVSALTSLISNIQRVTGDTNYVYVCAGEASPDQYVYIISKTTGGIVARIDTGAGNVPRDLALDGSGFLWVALISPSPTQGAAKFNIASAITAYPSDYTTVTAMAVVPAAYSCCYGGGYLWVGQKGAGLYQSDSLGNIVNSLSVGSANFYIHFGMLYHNGQVWAGSQERALRRYDPVAFPNPLCITEVLAPAGTQTSNPTYDSLQNLILTGDNGATGNIARWSTAAAPTAFVLEDYFSVTTAAPWGAIAIPSLSEIWVTDVANDRIQRWTDPAPPGTWGAPTYWTGPKEITYQVTDLVGDVVGPTTNNKVHTISGYGLGSTVNFRVGIVDIYSTGGVTTYYLYSGVATGRAGAYQWWEGETATVSAGSNAFDGGGFTFQTGSANIGSGTGNAKAGDFFINFGRDIGVSAGVDAAGNKYTGGLQLTNSHTDRNILVARTNFLSVPYFLVNKANGTLIHQIRLGSIGEAGQPASFTSTPTISTGTGSPEGVVTAVVGSLYTNLTGGALTTLYVKTSGTGNTGWTAK
jgi:hypothetical protein